MDKMFAFVGGWGFAPGPKGLHIFSYDPRSAEMEYIRTLHDEISVGYQYLDTKRGVLYLTDESGQPRGDTAGGYVMALALDQDRILVDRDGRDTLLPKPSYFWLDHTGSYALVAHHSNRGKVTKLARREDGAFYSRTVTDDAGLALFSINPDGSFGDLKDYVLTPGKEPFGPHASSHEHCVVASPDGELFLVCDKGLDCIYSFHLDRSTGKLELIHTTEVKNGYAPRYVVFHPELPVVYENNERQPILQTYRYHTQTGELQLLGSLPLCKAEAGQDAPPAAMLLHPNGKHLYTTVRGVNQITVLDIDPLGMPHVSQTLSCGGKNPRGLCLSPDSRYLLCANLDSNSITRFAVLPDGKLENIGEPVSAPVPGNIVIADLSCRR